jgi:RNA polymerase sigma-70 factor (ECF subfamily)
MLLTESRSAARLAADGSPVLLDQQDRRLWDRRLIDEGVKLVETALRFGRHGAYCAQAAIAAVHAEAAGAEDTDWPQIVGLYDVLIRFTDSPVVRLNRAVAVAMVQGPEAGLKLIDQLLMAGELDDYHLAWSARAEMCRRLGRFDQARDAYRKAIGQARQAVDRRFLERCLAELPLSVG